MNVISFSTYKETLNLIQTSKSMSEVITLINKLQGKTKDKMFDFFCKTVLQNIKAEIFLLTDCNFVYNSIDFIRSKSKKFKELPNGIFYHSKYIFKKPTKQFSFWFGSNFNSYLILYKTKENVKVYCIKKYYNKDEPEPQIEVLEDEYKSDDDLYKVLFLDLLLLRIY